MTVCIVKIGNRDVKVYAQHGDAIAFVEGLPNTTKEVEICVVPVEEYFDPEASMLDRNLSVPRGKYTVIDYQYRVMAMSGSH